MTSHRRSSRSPTGIGTGRKAAPSNPIRFGTSGWRGRLGDEITFPKLRVLVRAVADWIDEEPGGERVLVGFDGRFASADLALEAAQILREAGLRPALAHSVTPTPAITYALRRGRAAAGLVLTASHNPPADHGLKVFAAGGQAIDDRTARMLAARAAKRRRDDAPAAAPGRLRRFDFNQAYETALARFLDRGVLRRSKLKVYYDAMHGTGGGVLDVILSEAGLEVEGHRLDRDPLFGGAAPDPCAENLEKLSARIRGGRGLRLGLATDGDGDRIAVVDSAGRTLSETQVIAVLLDHLASEGKVRRAVALTQATGSLVEKVAEAHGLPVQRYPIGFKHLAPALLSGEADFAGEESGGFALGEMGCDKDGLLAACLLANLVGTSGQPIEAHVARLERAFGASACGRTAVMSQVDNLDALASLTKNPPKRVGRVSVVAVDSACGLRLALSDGGFLMLRRSGTEPRIRIYAEAPSTAALGQRLRQGAKMLRKPLPAD